MSVLQKLIVVLGLTASGKSSLAIELAKKFNGYIISADSRQIYKYMDIGTNKEMGDWVDGKYMVEGIEHFLIDIIEPDQNFSVADFQKMVYKTIDQQKKLNPEKIPIIAGGTGLYISAIVDNYDFTEKVKPEVRKQIEKELKEKGLDLIYKKLIKLDKLAKKNIVKDNPRRVVRALDFYLTNNKSLFARQIKKTSSFDVLQFGIKIDREILYKKIDMRVDQMIEQGLVAEVKKIHDRGYDWNLESMSGIGYKQIGMYLRKEIDLNEAIRLVKSDTRHYAKRQQTWFKRDKRIIWINDQKKALKIYDEFLHQKRTETRS